jgi:hypothetical protein
VRCGFDVPAVAKDIKAKDVARRSSALQPTAHDWKRIKIEGKHSSGVRTEVKRAEEQDD